MDYNFSNLLQKATISLAAYLESELPSLFDGDWWRDAVFNNLSFSQQRQIELRKITSLASLDLAALLRVFDQNWFQISSKLNLPSDARHYVKEMQTIRNRWAHASTEGFTPDDVYRDLDTLQRFNQIINADKNMIDELKSIKTSFFSRETLFPESREIECRELTLGQNVPIAEFKPGDLVFLKSNPVSWGAVTIVLPGQPENRFVVIMDNKKHTFYASQLQAMDQKDDDLQFTPSEQFHAHLTALQIQHPALSTLYSLNAARVDFIPYQFRPVIKFIRSDRPRLLIADGVGVGKTIEAGLILRELQARRDIRSVLIICPRPLVTEQKWKNEMKRFEERFEHLDSASLRYCINEMDLEGSWPQEHQKVIVPYSLFDEELLYGTGEKQKGKRKIGLLNLDPAPRFDLVIVDEAHHIRNQDTSTHKAVRFFCDNAEAVIFLTATPIQLGSHDLFVLLNTLRPDLIIDQESFDHMAEPNPFINQAVALARSQDPDWTLKTVEALDQAVSTPWGQTILKSSPDFERIRSRMIKGNISLEERIQLITNLESQHTFSGMINRTRRRDIGGFTTRKPITVNVNFTPAQKLLHDELLRVEAEIFSTLHGNNNVKFMLTTIRRQAASCLYGLIPFLKDILSRHLDELEWEEADDTEEMPDVDAFAAIGSQIKTILEKACKLDLDDPKLEALRVIIRDKQKLPNNKLMLFSSFRHTLQYLYKHLQADDVRCGLIHGNTPDDERVSLRDRFERQPDQEGALDVLLFSEVGCEGLDYQFCDCIVNYDLPWNPMRIEQRIGRIDRNGQKSEAVVIYNLITPGTVDADIYERCLMRIGVFNKDLGGSEEILGEIALEIRDIAENFSLSEAERGIKFQQLADNKIRWVQEQEALEDKQLEFFGIRLPEDQMQKEIEDASSFWLSAPSIQRLVTLYLQQTCGKEQEYILGEKSLKTLRLSQEARSLVLRDYQKLSSQNTSVFREWENWLKGNDPYLSITFEAECASQNPKGTFITPIHPLVKQAAGSIHAENRIVTVLKVKDKGTPAGRYQFAIYQWQSHGIREDLIFCPLTSSEIITPQLINLFKKAEEASRELIDSDDSLSWDDLERRHYEQWTEARDRHRSQTQELAKYRKESLSTSHRARINLLTEQLQQNENEKIRKMRRSQIDTADADYARHVQDLNIALERVDITAEVVAYGVLIVEEE
ncbi:MAG: SNF2-related protein [Chloroflexi bacterium]|nr:SNF2-related protein [Chloroflexota bacterium]